jgi:hypothetical protein
MDALWHVVLRIFGPLGVKADADVGVDHQNVDVDIDNQNVDVDVDNQYMAIPAA